MNRQKTGMLIGVSSLAALALATVIAQASTSKFENLQAATMDLGGAASAALSQVPGRVIEAELERDDGNLIWEVELVDQLQRQVEIEVDDVSGAVLRVEVESSDSRAPLPNSLINLDEAIAVVALSEPGLLIDAELESEAGTLLWEIQAIDDTGTKTEFIVDATTGKLLTR